MTLPPIANIFGFTALIFYILSLLPTIIKTILPNCRRNSGLLFLTKNRRHIGILAWVFGLVHGTFIVFERNLDLTSPKVWTTYFQGLLMATIFTLLAITSNNWSIKHLKTNWKKLHSLTYLVLIILPWHILDKTQNEWTYLTPIGLILLLALNLLFGYRLYLEYFK